MQQVNIVKIGSESATPQNIQLLGKGIHSWKQKTGEGFIVVSSGAKSLGQEDVLKRGGNPDLFSKSGLCAIGQSLLVNLYRELFSQDIILAQILVDDWQNKEFILKLLNKFKNHRQISGIIHNLIGYLSNTTLIEYLERKKDKHLLHTLSNLVENGVIAIVNHNDALSSTELSRVSRKTDNDLNVIHLCKIINDYRARVSFKVRKVVFLTNTHGLLDNNGNTVKGGDVSNIDEDEAYYLSFVNEKSKSDKGTGGMSSKVSGCLWSIRYGIHDAIISHSECGLDCLEGIGEFTQFTNSVK